MEKAEATTNVAMKKADKAQVNAEQLKENFELAKTKLEEKAGTSDMRNFNLQERANQVKQRAERVRSTSLSISSQLMKIKEAIKGNDEVLQQLQMDLSGLETRLTKAQENIQAEAAYYRDCTPN